MFEKILNDIWPEMHNRSAIIDVNGDVTVSSAGRTIDSADYRPRPVAPVRCGFIHADDDAITEARAKYADTAQDAMPIFTWSQFLKVDQDAVSAESDRRAKVSRSRFERDMMIMRASA